MKAMLIKDNPILKDVFLAHEYRDGSQSYKQDYKMASVLYSKAASKGNAEGAYNLGCLYQFGYGVNQDIATAINFFQMAANFKPKDKNNFPVVGVAEAQYTLGYLYQEGIYFDKKIDLAIQYYEKAIENESHEASGNLGLIYLEGKYVDKNLKKSEKLLKYSYQKGNQQALCNLVELYLQNHEPEKALEMHQQALQNGCLYSKNRDKEIQQRIQAEQYLPKNQNQNLFKKIVDYFSNQAQIKTPMIKNKRYSDEQLQDLQNRAQQQSITAKMILKIYMLVNNSHELILNCQNNIQQKELIVNNLAEAIQLDESQCFISSIRKEVFEILNFFIKKNQNQNSDIDEKSRVCYSYMIMSELEKNLEFTQICIEKYPNNTFFYYSLACTLCKLQQYEEGIIYFDQAFSIDPTNFNFVYCKAAAQRISGSLNAITSYKYFLQNAPYDNRKVPDGYYGLSQSIMIGKTETDLCKKEFIDEVLEYYKKGQQSEQYQLSIYIPYVSQTKIYMGIFLESLRPEMILEQQDKLIGIIRQHKLKGNIFQYAYNFFGKYAYNVFGKFFQYFYQAVHTDVSCDKSGMNPIVGTRYHMIGQNYDLCQAEFYKLSPYEQSLFESINSPVQQPQQVMQQQSYQGQQQVVSSPEQNNAENLLYLIDEDPYRKEIILLLRQNINLLKNSEQMKGFVQIFLTTGLSSKVANTNQARKNLKKGKKIYLRDMDPFKNEILQDQKLEVVNIEFPCFFGPSVHFVVEDENKDVYRLAVYNLGDDYNSIGKKYRIGCQITIFHPYCKIGAQDKKPIIRVDDPQNIIITKYLNNICRVCGKEYSIILCKQCGNALYCSLDCQQYDKNILKHELICK